MLARDGASAGDLLGWGHAGAAAFAVAWLLSAVNAQTQRATEALGSAREDALSRLAASERQRLEAERLAALGRLAATVAHELNGPLGAARSSAKFVREAVRERGEVAEACSDVVAALDRMALVVRQLGDLTRSEPAWSAPPPHSR
jgi:signal transduction histidine kinase